MSAFEACRRILGSISLCGLEKIHLEGSTYRKIENFAQGGFSEIYLVQNTLTKEYFALKEIECHSIEDQNAAIQEAKFHKKFKHTNILECVAFDVVGEADIVHNRQSTVRILLPFHKRGTLQSELETRLAKAEPLPQPLLVDLFRQICEGVHAMHSLEQPLAHRDLKPHNVLLTRDMTPVIMDLGSMAPARLMIANHKQAQQLQDVAGERCSITFRPPELFNVPSNSEIDERTDVWSLGCLLYAMCFFHSPFDDTFTKGDSVALAVQNKKSIKIPTDSPYSADIHNAILWMLTPNAVMRPHVIQILEQFNSMHEHPNGIS